MQVFDIDRICHDIPATTTTFDDDDDGTSYSGDRHLDGGDSNTKGGDGIFDYSGGVDGGPQPPQRGQSDTPTLATTHARSPFCRRYLAVTWGPSTKRWMPYNEYRSSVATTLAQ